MLSIVIPVHNEERSILPLYDRLTVVLESLRRPYEILFIDDASTDRSFELVIANQGEHFSVGANLFLVVMAAQQKEWEQIRAMVKNYQAATQRLKYATGDKGPLRVAQAKELLAQAIQEARANDNQALVAQAERRLADLEAPEVRPEREG